MKGVSKNREHMLKELTTLSAKVKAKAAIDNVAERKKHIEYMTSTWIFRIWYKIFKRSYQREVECINKNDYFDHYSWGIDSMIKNLKIKMLDEFIVANHELRDIRIAIKYIES